MILVPLMLALTPAMESNEATFFIGTYTSPGGSKGIYRASLDVRTGALSKPAFAIKADSPSFLALHPSGKFLYAVNESIGFVSAYAMGPGMKLTRLNGQKSGGSSPCHLSIDAVGRSLLVANYGGSGGCLPIQANGALGPASAIVKNPGSGPNTSRQEGSHIHSMYAVAGLVYACDLGTDDVLLYRLDQGALSRMGAAKVRPGSGPRHLAFHSNGKFAYVTNEMGNSVTAFARDARSGTLNALQTISTLPAGAHVSNTTAEILCHPNGRWLYVSNRGHDSIAVFQIGTAGKLKLLEVRPAGVREPRHFTLDPSGRWLVVAGQKSNDLRTLAVDPSTGKLSVTQHHVSVASPVCIVFARG